LNDESEQNDDCVEPIAIPAAEVGRYSPTRDPDSEQDVARYVEFEAQEKVSHVELIKSEFVAGERYDIWDVISENNRWWVITNITNLYSQKHFPSLDYTISFHIGLMLRLRHRPYKADEQEPHPSDPIFRRHDHASRLMDRAVEAEDFQAVAMQLREVLTAVCPLIKDKLPPHPVGEPKLGDFKAWCDYLATSAYSGESLKPVRKYLRDGTSNTWALVNWLTHYRGASKEHLKVADAACANVVSQILDMLFDEERNEERQTCPVCGSRNIRSHYDNRIEGDGGTYLTCGQCNWNTHPEGQERSFEKSALEVLDERHAIDLEREEGAGSSGTGPR